MMRFEWNDALKALLMGTGVVLLTPLLAGLVNDLEVMTYEVLPGMLTFGQIVAAGVSAYIIQLAMDNWMKR